MKRTIARLVSNVLTGVAKKISVTTYSAMWAYSPEIPNELTKE